MMDMYVYDNLLALCEASAAADDSPRPVLDAEHFSAFVKSPSDIDADMLEQLASLVDGKFNIMPKNYSTVGVSSPDSMDRLANAVTVIYITCDGLPVACATIVDPTEKNCNGYVPLDLYSLKSGYNLDGRVQQDIFAVMDEYRSHGLGAELRAQIGALGVPSFIVADADDSDTNAGLVDNGYQLKSSFNLDGNGSPVNLYISN